LLFKSQKPVSAFSDKKRGRLFWYGAFYQKLRSVGPPCGPAHVPICPLTGTILAPICVKTLLVLYRYAP
jgi:hypothetical protein